MQKAISKYWPVFVLPTLVAFIIGFIWPFIWGTYLSFQRFTTVSKTTFVGIQNYISVFQDSTFLHAFGFTAAFTVISTVLINVCAFAIAIVLTRGIKGTNIFRTVYFMPNLIGGILLGYIWQILLNGVLANLQKPLLALDAKAGFVGLVILMCWQQIGYMMIIYVAGLQSVPGDLIEAAKIDGASDREILFKIKLPMVMPSITICTFLTLTNIGVLGGSADISFAKGLLYLAACMPMAVIGLISAKQQAKAAVSSIALVAKRPDQFGKAMIFPAMVETYAVLALLVSLLAVANIGGIAI